jgi:hypothetical protein
MNGKVNEERHLEKKKKKGKTEGSERNMLHQNVTENNVQRRAQRQAQGQKPHVLVCPDQALGNDQRSGPGREPGQARPGLAPVLDRRSSPSFSQ